MKSFANIIELNITITDFIFYFIPNAGIYIAPVNEKNITVSYFDTVYNVKNNNLLEFENIGSIIVDNDRNYIEVFSLEALYLQHKSFYLFTSDNIQYIAINFINYESPNTKDILANQKNLYSDRFWFNENGEHTNIFNNQKALDIIQEIDTADIEGDALTFDTIQTNEMSTTLSNHDGAFDNFDNLYGNRFLVYKQFDYGISKIVFSGFIEKPEYNFLDSITITASDIRHSYSTTLPARSFNLLEYPELENFPENVENGYKKKLSSRQRYNSKMHAYKIFCRRHQ